MGTIIHDHLVITLDDDSTETMSEIKYMLDDMFPDTSYGPLQSKVNGFVTYGVTTSGSKMGFDTKNSYIESLDKLKGYLEKEDVSYVHLAYGDRGDSTAYIADCSADLKESVDDRGFLG